MQPQMPYGPPQGPYSPPSGPGAPGPDVGPGYGQPGPPNQLPGAGQYGQPGYAPGGPAYPNTGQPAAPYGGAPYNPNGNQPYPPQYAGLPPAMPQYQMPANLAHHRPGHPAPLPAPPPAKKTPYDFFLSQKHPTNTKNLPITKKFTLQGSLVWIIGGAFALMLIIFLIGQLTPKDTTNQDLFVVVQNQQEAIRVCNFGLKQARYQVNRNFAVNCVTGITTDQARLAGYLKQRGFKYSSKALSGLSSKQTDQTVTSATASSSFDDTYRQISEKQLTVYGSALAQELAAPNLPDQARTLLETATANNKLLIQQIQTQPTDMTEADSSD